MLLHEVRQGIRTLARRPVTSLLIVFTLAVGAGASASIFSLTEWLLFRSIPGVERPGQLITIRAATDDPILFPVSEPERADVEAGAPSLTRVTGVHQTAVHVVSGAGTDARRLEAHVVGGDYFGTLGGGTIARGRAFTADELRDAGRAAVAVISDRLWRSGFAANPAAAGGTIVLNGRPFTIVGIAARGFHGAERTSDADVWVPVAAHAALVPGMPANTLSNRRVALYMALVARLRDGATIEQAGAELEAIRSRMAGANPSNRRLRRYRFQTAAGLSSPAWERGRLTDTFGVLLGMAAILLALSCANVTNLMLAAAAARRVEFATREALGASRARVAVQTIVEALLLAFVAALVAILTAWWAMGLLRGTIVLPGTPALGDVTLDARVFAFTLIVGTITAVAAAAIPAIAAGRVACAATLASSGRTIASGARRLRQAFVVVQVALSLALLVGAVLLARSMEARRAIDAGFDRTGVWVLSVEPSLQGLADERQQAFYVRLIDAIRAVPGVSSAALSWLRPYSQDASDLRVKAAGASDDTALSADHNRVGTAYFATLGIPVVDGAEFGAADVSRGTGDAAAAPVVISESLATRLFGTVHASGRLVEFEGPGAAGRRVAGVVKDVRARRLTEPAPLQVYSPFVQTDWSTIVIRSAGPQPDLTARLRDAVRGIDPSLPVYDVMSLDDAVERHLAEDALVSRLAGLGALLATILAAVGLFGVLSQAIAERTVEFGIRTALGAPPASVVRLVVSDAFRLTIAGALLGALGTYWLVRYIEGRLYGVPPLDPVSFGIAAAVLLGVTLLAVALPAKRVRALDPVAALRR